MASGHQKLAPAAVVIQQKSGNGGATTTVGSNDSSRFISISSNGSSSPQNQRGYTILVPSGGVRYRGGGSGSGRPPQIDLKIDQKTLAATSTTSSIAKVVAIGTRTLPKPSTSATPDDDVVDWLDQPPPLLTDTMRLKTGGRNPREILTEKLKNVTKQHRPNGFSRSAAPSPSWFRENVSMSPSPLAGALIADSAPRPASAHVFNDLQSTSSSYHQQVVVNSTDIRQQRQPQLSSLLRLPSKAVSSSTIQQQPPPPPAPAASFTFDNLLEPTSVDDSPPLSSTIDTNGHFMHMHDATVIDSPSLNSFADNGIDDVSTHLAETRPIAKRRRGDKSSQGSHFCEFMDADGQRSCKQRAILTFNYCIRHILNDPDAPYKACEHKRKPKSKKDFNLQCTNAIRTDKPIPFCSTHMIMKGMMEPKSKKNGNNTAAAASTSNCQNGLHHNSAIPTLPNNHNEWQQQQQHQHRHMTNGDHCLSPGAVSDERLSSGYGEWTSSVQHASPYPPASPMMTSHYPAPVQGVGSLIAHHQHSPALVSPLPSSSTAPYWNNSTQLQRHHPIQIASAHPMRSLLPPQPPPIGYHSSSAQQQYTLPSSAQNGSLIDNYGGGVSPMSGPQSNARSSSVTSANSRPDSVTPDVFLSSSTKLTAPARHITATTNLSIQPQSELMRQHPELAAKLQSVRPGAAAATIQVDAPPIVGRAPEFARPAGQQQTTRATVNNAPVTCDALSPANQPLPWMAPVFHQSRPSVVPIHADTLSSSTTTTTPVTKKVIRLKQKRQRMRMLGQYRQIPAVNQMCKVLEDADFDKTDLFPLGLEPSESDTDSDDDCEGGFGSGRATDACFSDRILRLANEWLAEQQRDNDYAPNDADDIEGWPTDTAAAHQLESISRRQLYLIKKQLRLERHRLLRQARTNAAVMHASKRYTNSVGRALTDRRKCDENPLLMRYYRQQLGIQRRFVGSTATSRRVPHGAGAPRNCCYRRVDSGERCELRSLPYSNHCRRHIVYNVDQRLFGYCEASMCGEPIIDFGRERWQPFGPRCPAHRLNADGAIDRRPSQQRRRLTPIDNDNECDDDDRQVGTRGIVSRLPSKNIIVRTGGGDTSAGSLDKVPGGSSSLAAAAVNIINEADVSLASVANDLGFEGSVLTEMLARFPVDGGGGAGGDDIDALIAQDFAAKSVAVEPTSIIAGGGGGGNEPPTQLDLGTHSWADVEQFLLSEGYEGDSFRPNMLMHHHHLLPSLAASLSPLDGATQPSVQPPPPYVTSNWSPP